MITQDARIVCHQYTPDERSFSAVIQQCGAWDDELTSALTSPSGVAVFSFMTKFPPNEAVLSSLVTCMNQPPVLRLLLPSNPSVDPRPFILEHEQCINLNYCLVVGVGSRQMRELVLIPVHSLIPDNPGSNDPHGGSSKPVFWGFVCTPYLTLHVRSQLAESRIGVIFDLDETLLLANTASSLMSKIEQARRTRQSFEIELSKFSYLSSLQPAHRNPQDEASVGHIQLQVEALSREEELLALDLKLLQQYMNDDLIRLPSGGALETKIEVGPSEPEEGGRERNGKDISKVERKVIRTEFPPGYPVMFTTINPNDKSTAMVMRVRPHWEELRSVLGPQSPSPSNHNGNGRRKFDVYVCTAAQRGYALEAWRMLDPNGLLISESERKRKIVNVNQANNETAKKKSILETILPHRPKSNPERQKQRRPSNDVYLSNPDADNEGLVPLTLVVDDRVEVWEKTSQPQILQVIPWNYYRDEAQKQAMMPHNLSVVSDQELRRVQASILSLRRDAFRSINEDLKPRIDNSFMVGFQEEFQNMERFPLLLPKIQTIPNLLKSQDARGQSLFSLPNSFNADRSIGHVNSILDPLGAAMTRADSNPLQRPASSNQVIEEGAVSSRLRPSSTSQQHPSHNPSHVPSHHSHPPKPPPVPHDPRKARSSSGDAKGQNQSHRPPPSSSTLPQTKGTIKDPRSHLKGPSSSTKPSLATHAAAAVASKGNASNAPGHHSVPVPAVQNTSLWSLESLTSNDLDAPIDPPLPLPQPQPQPQSQPQPPQPQQPPYQSQPQPPHSVAIPGLGAAYGCLESIANVGEPSPQVQEILRQARENPSFAANVLQTLASMNAAPGQLQSQPPHPQSSQPQPTAPRAYHPEDTYSSESDEPLERPRNSPRKPNAKSNGQGTCGSEADRLGAKRRRDDDDEDGSRNGGRGEGKGAITQHDAAKKLKNASNVGATTTGAGRGGGAVKQSPKKRPSHDTERGSDDKELSPPPPRPLPHLAPPAPHAPSVSKPNSVPPQPTHPWPNPSDPSLYPHVVPMVPGGRAWNPMPHPHPHPHPHPGYLSHPIGPNSFVPPFPINPLFQMSHPMAMMQPRPSSYEAGIKQENESSVLGRREGTYRDMGDESSEDDDDYNQGEGLRGTSDDYMYYDEEEGEAEGRNALHREDRGGVMKRSRGGRKKKRGRGVDPYALVKAIVSEAQSRLPPDLSQLLTFNKKGETHVKKQTDSSGAETFAVALSIGPFKYPFPNQVSPSYGAALNVTSMAICRNLGLVKELPPPGITRLTRRVTREMKEDAVVTLMKKIEAFESKRLEREQNKKQLPAVGKKRPEAAAGGDPHDHNRGGRPQMQVPAAVTHGPPPSSMPPPPAAAVSHNPPQGLASAPPVGYSQSMGMGPPAVSYSQPMVSSAGAPMGGGQNPWMWTQPQPFPFHSPFFPTAPRPAGFLPYN